MNQSSYHGIWTAFDAGDLSMNVIRICFGCNCSKVTNENTYFLGGPPTGDFGNHVIICDSVHLEQFARDFLTSLSCCIVFDTRTGNTMCLQLGDSTQSSNSRTKYVFDRVCERGFCILPIRVSSKNVVGMDPQLQYKTSDIGFATCIMTQNLCIVGPKLIDPSDYNQIAMPLTYLHQVKPNLLMQHSERRHHTHAQVLDRIEKALTDLSTVTQALHSQLINTRALPQDKPFRWGTILAPPYGMSEAVNRQRVN